MRKSFRKFSAIAIDHAHEKNNKHLKGNGGVICLTESSSQLLRSMVSGPELARLLSQFQSVSTSKEESSSRNHHEQTKSMQINFMKQVNDLCNTVEELGNPFIETSQDLLVQKRESSKRQYLYSIQLKETNSVCSAPSPKPKIKTMLAQQVPSLKQNCSLFSKLYVSCQIREGNLDQYFAHENLNYPPSIS